jgi:hypothetical protein
MTVRHVLDGGIDVYLHAGSNRQPLLYQCGHEAFHAACGPGLLHWTHELLAVQCSLRYLHSAGEDDYLRRVIAEDLMPQAERMSQAEALVWQGPAYVEGLYGRLFLLGEALIAATSWDDLKGLASCDVAEWLAGLGAAKRDLANAVLNPTA